MYVITPDKIATRKSRLQACMDGAENGGSNLLVIKDGQELLYLESGVKRDNIFRCYSMTKPITAAAAMKLIQDGVISLDDPVSKYIEGFFGINIFHLLNMTSGLGYESYPDIERAIASAISTYDFAKKVGQCKLLFQPGTSWEYGVSADVLGAVIEVAVACDLQTYLRSEILLPLGMADTDFYVPEEKKHRLVDAWQDGEVYTEDFIGIKTNGDMPAFYSGGAGLFSTIDDYAKFAQSLLNGKILREDTIKYMTTHGLTKQQQSAFDKWEGVEGYTYGNYLRVMQNPSIASVPANKGEYGWEGWMGTFFCNDPATRTTIVIMQNVVDGDRNGFARKLKTMLYL